MRSYLDTAELCVTQDHHACLPEELPPAFQSVHSAPPYKEDLTHKHVQNAHLLNQQCTTKTLTQSARFHNKVQGLETL